MRRISPKIYDQKYFESERCEGFVEYKDNKLSYIKQIEINLLNLNKNDTVLDVGCGRGDIPHYLSAQNYNFWATDYSEDAIKITKRRVKQKYKKQIILADARKFSIKHVKFTKILIGDVVEHMTYSDAVNVVNKLYDQLDENGVLVIHTAPNTWFKKYTYPLARITLGFLGFKEVVTKLDENIKGTHDYHIDEYSPVDLQTLMKKSKFKKYKIWINRDVVRTSSTNYLDPIKKSLFLRIIIWIINNSPLIYFVGNDLFVVARKQ